MRFSTPSAFKTRYSLITTKSSGADVFESSRARKAAVRVVYPIL